MADYPIVSFVLLFLWLVVLLYMLGATAEDHFCPALSHIADTLRLSPDVAGITILAFGNGSPDVFSIFAAVQQGKFNIALNELTGSGSFVTMAVVSAIAFFSVARLNRYPFVRDASLYFGAQAFVFYVVYDGKITLAESIGLLVYYFLYVALVVVVQAVLKRRAAGSDDASQQLRSAPSDDADNEEDYFSAGADALDGHLGWGASDVRRSVARQAFLLAPLTRRAGRPTAAQLDEVGPISGQRSVSDAGRHGGCQRFAAVQLARRVAAAAAVAAQHQRRRAKSARTH